MIAFRWSVASGGEKHPFEPEALKAIFEHSRGVPREACMIADNSLLLAFYRKKSPIAAELVREVVADRRSVLKLKEAQHGEK